MSTGGLESLTIWARLLILNSSHQSRPFKECTSQTYPKLPLPLRVIWVEISPTFHSIRLVSSIALSVRTPVATAWSNSCPTQLKYCSDMSFLILTGNWLAFKKAHSAIRQRKCDRHSATKGQMTQNLSTHSPIGPQFRLWSASERSNNSANRGRSLRLYCGTASP